MSKEEVMGIFREVTKGPFNGYLEKRIADGGKIIGYHCNMIPGEIFTAAGLLPYRIRGAGSTDTSLADVYLSNKLCTFVRHTVNLALDNKFVFLNGIVSMNACDQIRRAHDTWKREIKNVSFAEFLSVPRTKLDGSLDWYKTELERLIGTIEEHFSVKITDQSLLEAIKLHNTLRRNLIKLNELRKGQNPPVTGSEALTISIAAHVMPINDFNQLIEKLINNLPKDEIKQNYRCRFVVTGGELDEPEFIRVIEEQGGLVVYDDVCFGSFFYNNLVSEEGDPLDNLVDRYLNKSTCARMVNTFNSRNQHLREIMIEYKADGIIFQRIKFCITNGGLSHNFMNSSRIDGVPTLNLDREYLAGGSGQLKTRVQAFIESIESRSKRGAV